MYCYLFIGFVGVVGGVGSVWYVGGGFCFCGGGRGVGWFFSSCGVFFNWFCFGLGCDCSGYVIRCFGSFIG